ncbi:FAD-dependent oxidoreductase [Lentisphaera profundi]|uniref:FAD-dependent oxidoreductase n=1 Tax=Lentisphaera profundi TaxID=1658616 RepID=A0ABY7W1W2_9BACT|nr:FAD-dependent oxidoreductase [Lentisphaera profundi]WDE98996.1 FAD-dependent oxidoreductase [Lentisphaera profundi]
MKKVAIIGTGISGLSAAYKLKDDYDVHLFEAGNYIGGHTNTLEVKENNKTLNIDTGFIVFNDWTYPNFIKLMDELGVESQVSDMSFSVKCEESGLEYNGTSLNTLFAQRRNMLKPSFWKMIKDILNFNKAALLWLEQADVNDATTLGQYIEPYGDLFRDKYILPMTAAIWSAGRESSLNFPLRFYLNFFKNHGFLSVDERPVWRVIKNGSKAYIPKIIAGFEDKIYLECPVISVKRLKGGVSLSTKRGEEFFDGVIFSCHSDQALKILGDATQEEQDILGAIPYQANEAILHTDQSVLPKRPLAWAAWNYHLTGQVSDLASLTYNMNILQSLDCEKSYNVSLNYDKIDKSKIIRKISYSHPVFTLEGVKAQKRHSEISGVNNTFFAGAYWSYGFHEDGAMSGLKAAEQLRGIL